MAVTTLNNTRRFVVAEPLRAAWDHGNQALVTSAAAFMSAMFSMQHDVLPWYIAWPLAVGFEWTYLRGLANGEKTLNTKWSGALNWSAMLTSVVFGILYILGHYEVIPAKPDGWAAVLLALAHVVPMAVLSFCGAKVRQERKLQELRRNQIEEDEEVARNRRLRGEEDRLRLEMQRKEAELELWKKGQVAKSELKQLVAQPRTATEAQPQPQPKRNREIVYNGVTYPSIQAAADAHGISRQAMTKRLAKQGE